MSKNELLRPRVYHSSLPFLLDYTRMHPEQGIPLKVYSKEAMIDDILAVSSAEHLLTRAKSRGLAALPITNPNLYGLPQSQQKAQELSLRSPIAAEVEVITGAVNITPTLLFARSPEGVLDIFNAVSHQKLVGPSSPNQIHALLQTSQVIVVFEGDYHAEPVQDILLDPNAFYAILTGEGKARNLAWHIEGKSPHEGRHPGKVVATNEVRLATPQELPVAQFLLAAFPQLARQVPHGLLNYVLQQPGPLFPKFPQGSLARTLEIIEEAKGTIPPPPPVHALLPPKWEANPSGYLRSLLAESLAQSERGSLLSARVDQERRLLEQFGYVDYVLVCRQIADFCRARGIEYSVAGSGNNSVVLHLLGITNVEASDLPFTTFLSKARPDLPDVDFLIEYERLPEVIRSLLDASPNEAVPIAKILHLRERGVINLAREIAQKTDERATENLLTKIVDAELPIGRAHSSGIILTKSTSPLDTAGGNVLSQWDKHDIEALAIPKFDLLSSIALQRIASTKRLLAKDGRERQIHPNDRETLHWLFSKSPKIGVSLWDSPHLVRLATWMGAVTKEPALEHIALVLAVARPAAAPLRQELFAALQGEENPLAGDEALAEILGNTGFVPVFEEQEEQLTQWLAAHEGDATTFVQKVSAQVERIADQYKFKEGHARALAQVVYNQAYLAVHVPEYFCSAVLKTVADRPVKPKPHTFPFLYPPQAFINEALRRRISIVLPDPQSLPEYPEVRHGKLTIGWKLLGAKKHVLPSYGRVFRRYQESQSLKEKVDLLLNTYGVSPTANPIIVFGQEYHFHPRRPEQTIIGLPIASRVIQRRNGELVRLLTLDSGTLINAAVPKSRERHSLRDLGYFGYVQCHIRHSQQFPDSWDII